MRRPHLTEFLQRSLCGLLVVAVAFVVASAPDTASAAPAGDDSLTVVTVPALPGAIFEFDGRTFVAGSDGSFVVQDPGELRGMADRLSYEGFEGDPTVEATFTRWAGLTNANRTRRVEAVFETSRWVEFTFVDLDAKSVPIDRITTMTLKNSMGVFFEFDAATLEDPVLLPSQRAVQSFDGYLARPLYYTVQDVEIDGTNTVNRSQQKFFPSEVTWVEVETQFFYVSISARDALFGFDNGSAALVRWPDGRETRHEVVDGVTNLYLPRGDYDMRVDGSGLETWRPVSVSRDQELELELFSYFDIGFLVTSVLTTAGVLVILGRRRHRPRRGSRSYFLDADAPRQLAEHDIAVDDVAEESTADDDQLEPSEAAQR